MMLKLFSSQKENSFNTERQEKFELVSCPLNGKYCSQVRSAMNKRYAESVDFRRNKEYEKSLNALEQVYEKTMELPDSPCAKCTDFFRSTITDSVENIHSELVGMSKGIFGTSRYQTSCEKAEQLLQSFRPGARELKSAI